MYRAPLVALLLFAASPALADDRADALADIKANCKAEWPGNYSMQEYCIEKQVKAINAMSRIYKSALNDEEKGILDKCLTDWTKERGAIWAMVEYCYQKQHQSYVRLKGN